MDILTESTQLHLLFYLLLRIVSTHRLNSSKGISKGIRFPCLKALLLWIFSIRIKIAIPMNIIIMKKKTILRMSQGNWVLRERRDREIRIVTWLSLSLMAHRQLLLILLFTVDTRNSWNKLKKSINMRKWEDQLFYRRESVHTQHTMKRNCSSNSSNSHWWWRNLSSKGSEEEEGNRGILIVILWMA